MKQLEVQIMQQSYLLSCPEGREARMLDAVERVDTAMCKIRDAGKIKARDRIAVLAALNMAYELTDAPAAGAERAPASAPQPSSASSSAAAQAPALSVAEQATLGALLSRLDKALGDDGRLI